MKIYALVRTTYFDTYQDEVEYVTNENYAMAKLVMALENKESEVAK